MCPPSAACGSASNAISVLFVFPFDIRLPFVSLFLHTTVHMYGYMTESLLFVLALF